MMINGSPFGFFQSSRGLREGDLLSPYLFVIVMESFSQLLKRAVDGGFISTCNVGGFIPICCLLMIHWYYLRMIRINLPSFLGF